MLKKFSENLRNLIIDMDGVLWLGGDPLPGLKEFFDYLSAENISWILATNNSSRSPEQYAAKLTGLGIETSPNQVITSAGTAADYLSRHAPPGTPVYVIGGSGLRQALDDQGYKLREDDVRFVVVGWDRNLTWDKLARASLLIHAGATFIGTNPDLSYPTSQGPVPGCGAQLKAIEAATGTAPIILGKPEPFMYRQALERLGARPEDTAMLGDRIDTDLAGAEKLGISTILVLSGVVTEDKLRESAFQPDLVYRDIEELTASWMRR